MSFGEKLKKLRVESKISQVLLAKSLGVSTRTIQKYESGQCHPKSMAIMVKLSEFFKIDISYFLSDEDLFAYEAEKEYGSTGKSKANKLLQEAGALLAGGELDEDDKELFYKSITELFWETREANKKFIPKKYL